MEPTFSKKYKYTVVLHPFTARPIQEVYTALREGHMMIMCRRRAINLYYECPTDWFFFLSHNIIILYRLQGLVPDLEKCPHYLPDASRDNQQQTYYLPQRGTAFREVSVEIMFFCFRREGRRGENKCGNGYTCILIYHLGFYRQRLVHGRYALCRAEMIRCSSRCIVCDAACAVTAVAHSPQNRGRKF